jgi:rubrerythrin
MPKTKELTEALNQAMDLEVEGRRFYMECMNKTKSKAGAEMFKYLAEEEAVHYDKLERMYRREFNKEFEAYRNKHKYPDKETEVFEGRVRGGSVDGKSDALDALNIGLKTEQNSVVLYKQLYSLAQSDTLKKLFSNLIDEERRHHKILENEVEAVTGTGTYTDFKVVTS